MQENEGRFLVRLKREQVCEVEVIADWNADDEELARRALSKAKPESWSVPKNQAYFDVDSERVEEE